MVVVSGEGLKQLAACSSSEQGKGKKHVIYYPRYDMEHHARGLLVCVPVDNFIPHETPPFEANREFEQLELPCSEGVSYICTPTTTTTITTTTTTITTTITTTTTTSSSTTTVDNLIPHETTPPSEANKIIKLLELPCSEGAYLNFAMSCICTPTTTNVGAGKRTSPGPGLYFFGGLEYPPEICHHNLLNEYVSKKVYHYDLRELPKIRSMIPRKEMIYGMSRPLLAQVGEDCIYVLSYGNTQFNDRLKPAFQEYNFKEDKWTPLGDEHFVDMIINKCDCDQGVRDRLHCVPHVVIGRKLHVSIGNSSFTFDTVERAWEDCKLFKTFWSRQEKKNGFSPSNFYGRRVWDGAYKVAKKRKRAQFGGGPPFGFYGRGILWDTNILLGVHYATNCPLVAFLLDDEGRVVKSQGLSLNNLAVDGNRLRHGARLVDLGRDGYFGLVHFLSDKNIKSYCDSGNTLHVELVAFQVSRLPKEIAAAPDDHGDYDDDHFLECEVVRKEFVAKNCSDSIGHFYNAFCV